MVKKPIYRLAMGTVLLASLPLMAEQPGAGAQQSIRAASSGLQDSAAAAEAEESRLSAHDLALAAEYLRPVSAALQGKLDAKTARPGSLVVMKTTRDTVLADGTEIPKGSRLVGQVTQVEAQSQNHGDSQLTLALVRAELKGGFSVPIHAMIQAVAPPSAGVLADGSMNAGGGFMGADTMTAANAAVPGGEPMGGIATTGSPVGGQPDPSADGALDAIGNVSGAAVGPVDTTLAGARVGTLSAANHPTEIPGVMLRGYIVGPASGTLSAAGEDIRLDSGAQILLGLAAK